MIELVEISLKDLLVAFQSAQLYGREHPLFKQALEKAYSSIRTVLESKNEFVVGIIGDELIFEKEIFFELSKLVKPLIGYLKERQVERIIFKSGITLQELNKFIDFLLTKKEELGDKPEEYLILNGVEHISTGKVKAFKEESLSLGESIHKTARGLKEYEESLRQISKPFNDILSKQKLDPIALKLAVSGMLDGLDIQFQHLMKLSTFKRYDFGTFVHLLNVAILSMYFSSKLGLTRDAILEIGISALFHDIGKLYISRKIIRKPDKLSLEEFTKIESHTVLGAQMMLEYTDKLGMMPVVVSFEHHLKYDLSGYPKLAFPKNPNIASQIVSICDVYDALSQRRSYKSDYPPQMIYGIMIRQRGTAFNPKLLDKFFKMMGVWPIGSIIELSDNRIALVIAENEDDINCPIVKILDPLKNKGELVDLKLSKETLRIQRYLNPWTEAKDFINNV